MDGRRVGTSGVRLHDIVDRMMRAAVACCGDVARDELCTRCLLLCDAAEELLRCAHYRAALRDIARPWPRLGEQAIDTQDLPSYVGYLTMALRGEQRTAREALGDDE
jgi:hypothetical protein